MPPPPPSTCITYNKAGGKSFLKEGRSQHSVHMRRFAGMSNPVLFHTLGRSTRIAVMCYLFQHVDHLLIACSISSCSHFMTKPAQEMGGQVCQSLRLAI